jgi:hypothetical protein
MGGFFGGYVVANLVALAAAVVRQRTAVAKRAALFFAGLTVVVASLPQSHELRYYMVWILVLVSTNLALWAKDAPNACGLVAAAALAVVAWSTEGTYLYASGDSFPALVAQKVDRAALEGVAPGERVCVAREPWTFLYAPRFHPGKAYVIQEAEGSEDCAGARSLDAP